MLGTCFSGVSESREVAECASLDMLLLYISTGTPAKARLNSTAKGSMKRMPLHIGA